MPDKLSIEQFAAEIKKRRPDLAGIPNDTLVGKTLGAAPELKEYVNLDTTMPAPEGILSQLFGHLGVQKSDPATPIAGMSPAGAPIINPMQPSVASEGAAQSLRGMGNAITGAPTGTASAIKMALTGDANGLVNGLYGQAKDVLGPIVHTPPPGSPEWEKAQQGAGASLIAAEMPNALSPLAEALTKYVPSQARAGANFDTAMAAAKDVPLDLTAVDDSALRALELGGKGRIIGRGNTLPKAISDYIRTRESSPNMTYEAGRDFATNFGDISAGEKMLMNGPMRRLASALAKSMDSSVQAAAEKAGVGAENSAAMAEYRRLMTAKKLATNAVKAAAGGTAIYELHRALTK